MQEYAEIVVERDGDRDLKFVGKMIASAFSNESITRVTELHLYRAKSGKFVCERITRTRWVNEQGRCEASVCEGEHAVIDFFGYSSLAKLLYAQAAIPVVVAV